MITRVAIRNYACFADVEFELPRRLSLVGSNGSGKTSLWQALVALQEVIIRGEEVNLLQAGGPARQRGRSPDKEGRVFGPHGRQVVDAGRSEEAVHVPSLAAAREELRRLGVAG